MTEEDKNDLIDKLYKSSLSVLKDLKSKFSKDTSKSKYEYLKDVFSRKRKPRYKPDELNVLEDKEGHFTTHWVSGYTNKTINVSYKQYKTTNTTNQCYIMWPTSRLFC